MAEGIPELSDGRYFVEVNASSQFRLVDDSGTPIDIVDPATGELSGSWLDIPDAATSFAADTGRGVVIQFDATAPYDVKTYNGSPPAESVEYDAWGIKLEPPPTELP